MWHVLLEQEHLTCKVFDKMYLDLEIFGSRAASAISSVAYQRVGGRSKPIQNPYQNYGS